jgi:pimeloyl-ACP methyl ester carboxylesterase
VAKRFLPLSRFSAALADRLILSPTRHEIPAFGRSPLRVTQGDIDLELWVQRTEVGEDARPGPFVLKFPGTGSRAEDAENLAMRCWEDQDVVLWSVNPPGYGNSGGRASLGAIPAMAMAAVERIRDAAGERPVVAEGFSLGTVAALFLAAQGQVDGLILRNPPPLREILRHRTGWWSLGLVPVLVASGIPETADSVRNAAQCRVPALFVTALKDRVVPVNCQNLVVDAYGGPSRVLEQPDGEHATPLSAPQTTRLKGFATWLLDSIERTRTARGIS